MCKVLLFVDMEFPRGRGDQIEKSWKFQGVGGSTMKPLGMENPGGWGSNLKKPSMGGGGGYGYFLEPHNPTIESERTQTLSQMVALASRHPRQASFKYFTKYMPLVYLIFNF